MGRFNPCSRCGSTEFRTVIRKKQYMCVKCRRVRFSKLHLEERKKK